MQQFYGKIVVFVNFLLAQYTQSNNGKYSEEYRLEYYCGFQQFLHGCQLQTIPRNGEISEFIRSNS
jgi:hypothetical protein